MKPLLRTGTMMAALVLAPDLAPAASEKVLYSFTGGRDGGQPGAGLIDVGGTLYGTAAVGGRKGCRHLRCGTVFTVTKAGVERVVYAFKGNISHGPDGAVPGSLIDVGATLYGVTFFGGARGEGTVFELTKAGVERVVHSFKGRDGDEPNSGLINVGGALYGTTYRGGASNEGTVFKLTKAGVETVLYSFKGGNDGANPDGGLVAVGGTLYGTTYGGGGSAPCSGGCGTVFKVTKAGAETVLYSFAGPGGGDGANPVGPLIDAGGTLYGTTSVGGASDDGTVYKITKDGAETVVLSFSGNTDGTDPTAGLIDVHGAFYGTTVAGGPGGYGTVFKLTKAGVETVLYSFKSGSDGAYPVAGVIDVGGALYGTTEQGGGTSDEGTVFKVTR